MRQSGQAVDLVDDVPNQRSFSAPTGRHGRPPRTGRPRRAQVAAKADALSARRPFLARFLQSRAGRLVPTASFLLADVLALAVLTGLPGPKKRYLLLAALLLPLYAAGGLYRPRLTLSVLSDLPSLAGRALAAAALVASSTFTRDHRPGSGYLIVAAGLLITVPAFRSLAYAAVRQLRRRHLFDHRTLILGAGRVGAQIAQAAAEHPEFALQPVGFLDSSPFLVDGDLPLPVLGGTDALATAITNEGARHVVIAFGSAREADMVSMIRTCDRLDCEIFFVPRLFELHAVSCDMEEVLGLPLVRLRRAAFRTYGWRLKRIMDVVFATIICTLLAPLIGAIALGLRVTSGPNVLFRQERVGLDGNRFRLFKFCTLRPEDDEESQTLWNVSADERLTPFGRLLRRSSLDELPQLFNVLRGEMSLVGPRPERPHFVERFSGSFPRYGARSRVPSGLTGWAQIHGLRGDTSIEERARFDNYYIENWSMWLDVKILLRTAVCFAKAAK